MDDDDDDDEIQEIEEPKAQRASLFVFLFFFLLAFPCPHRSLFTEIKRQLRTRSTSRLSNLMHEFLSHARACLAPYHSLYYMQ